jgi:hypothetical protein
LTRAETAINALSARVPEFTAHSERLADALARLTESTKVRLDVRWDDLTASGITRDSIVDVSVRNVTASHAIRAIVEQLSAVRSKLSPELTPEMASLDNGTTLITTRGDLFKRSSSERRYDLSELIVANGSPAIQKQVADQTAKLVQDTIQPDSWSATKGSIRTEGSTLLIVQTDENHHAIASLISRLRLQMHAKNEGGEGQAIQLPPPPVLTKMVGELVLKGTSLEDAIQSLREATGQNIFVHWNALNKARVTETLPVTINLSSLPLDQALDHLLEAVGGQQARLQYSCDEGMIFISTTDDLAKNVTTRVYDVRRAIASKESAERDVAALIRRVEGIEPLSWKDAGGSFASVRELNGQLIVTQMPEVHKRITEELQDLLEAGPVAHQRQ